MFVILTIIHVLVCVFLIIVVLLQSGKAADLAGAFGGMGSQTAFGPRGSATLLSKATTISAVVFMVTSLSLSILATRSSGVGNTVLDKTQQSQQAPAKTAPPAAPQQQAPAQQAPGVPAGKPSVTITPEGGGPSRTYPLDIQPAPGQKPPAQPAPAKK
ncbi:MAG: preprotein translocase subunit SecG [Acidobacteria bacterium]|nr:preprotein translocase subunit SecG [Acidobacteriota bacterium]